jgi:Protein of unknown function (DUF551)
MDDNWQPIETAPKDEFVLICTAKKMIYMACYSSEDGCWWPAFFECNHDDLPKNVTHWMALPAAPNKS